MTHIKMGIQNCQVRCFQPVAKQFLRHLTYSLKIKYRPMLKLAYSKK